MCLTVARSFPTLKLCSTTSEGSLAEPCTTHVGLLGSKIVARLLGPVNAILGQLWALWDSDLPTAKGWVQQAHLGTPEDWCTVNFLLEPPTLCCCSTRLLSQGCVGQSVVIESKSLRKSFHRPVPHPVGQRSLINVEARTFYTLLHNYGWAELAKMTKGPEIDSGPEMRGCKLGRLTMHNISPLISLMT